MRFCTQVSIRPPGIRIYPGSRLLFLGSCFAGVIGRFWLDCGLKGSLNPFGKLFNPASVLSALQLLQAPDAEEKLRTALFCDDSLWHSFFFHSAFSDVTADLAWQKMRTSLEAGREALRQADVLFLTWGSALAWYHHSVPEQVVANCHCLPEKEFTRRLIPAAEISSCSRLFFDRLLKEKPSLQIILSVSPVRHHAGDLPLNSVSKAQLLTAAHELRQAFPERVHYFPAFEILLDELRDYRFYAEDLCHPSPLAEQLIRERFLQTWGSPELLQYLTLAEELRQIEQHRPRLPESAKARLRQQQAGQRKQQLTDALEQLRRPCQGAAGESAPAAAGRRR